MENIVTILILVDGFLQYHNYSILFHVLNVTILILVDGFLQYNKEKTEYNLLNSHNPYFSRWFSAIRCKNGFKL